MILFLADGRLGNQIFQYFFLKTIQKNNEKIITSGFEDLKEVFEINGIVNINKKNKWLRNISYRILRPTLNFLADKKMISSIHVNHEKVLENYRREVASYTQTKGFVTFVTFVKLGFFQSESLFDDSIAKDLKIKERYVLKAEKFLKGTPDNVYKIFIHIRRGDYKDFKVYGKSSLLPISYFKNQIEWFFKNKEKCFFIFLSDDPDFIEKEFKYIDNKIVSTDNHYGTDFAIMMKCNSSILSPSSFGWWGSYFMKNREVVFSPKYWLGFNSKVEYQSQCTAKFMEEVEIK